MSWNGLTMKPEARSAWTDALRSGNFTQSRFTLRRCDGSSCCLGVFAEINNVPREQSDAQADCRYSFPYIDDSPYYSFTSLEIDWFSEFFDFDPTTSGGQDKHHAVSRLTGQFMEFNDAEGKPFPEIADWIEENLS